MDDVQRQALILVGYIFLASGKIEKALSLLEGARSGASDDPYLPRALSFAYIRAGRFEQALAESDKCLARSGAAVKDRRCALLLKAHALWALGRDAERRRAVEELMALSGAGEGGHE